MTQQNDTEILTLHHILSPVCFFVLFEVHLIEVIAKAYTEMTDELL